MDADRSGFSPITDCTPSESSGTTAGLPVAFGTDSGVSLVARGSATENRVLSPSSGHGAPADADASAACPVESAAMRCSASVGRGSGRQHRIGIPLASPDTLHYDGRCTRSAEAAPAETVCEPPAALTEALVADVAASTFVASTTGPIESGRGAVVRSQSKRLVHLVHNAVGGWPQSRIDELSSAYGNFDRVVAQGWLVATLLGLPPIERGEAFRLGGAVRKRAAKIQAEIDGIERDARQRARTLDPADVAGQQALSEATAAKLEALLSEGVTPALPLPSAPPPRSLTVDLSEEQRLRADLKTVQKREARARKVVDEAKAALASIIIPEEPDQSAYDEAVAAVDKLSSQFRKPPAALSAAQAHLAVTRKRAWAEEEKWERRVSQALSARQQLEQLRDAKWRTMMQAQSERCSIEWALADERDRRQRHEREEKQQLREKQHEIEMQLIQQAREDDRETLRLRFEAEDTELQRERAERERTRAERSEARARGLWSDHEARLKLVCSSLDGEDVVGLMHEIVRLRGENRNLRGETSREDAFDVLSELLDVQRDGDMYDWMPQSWDPRCLCDSYSD